MDNVYVIIGGTSYQNAIYSHDGKTTADGIYRNLQDFQYLISEEKIHRENYKAKNLENNSSLVFSDNYSYCPLERIKLSKQ